MRTRVQLVVTVLVAIGPWWVLGLPAARASSQEDRVPMPNEGRRPTPIAAGDRHSCALEPDGDAQCWGDNTFGQAPPGGVTGPFTQVTAGGSHTCALRPNGDAQCWGDNTFGQAPPGGVTGPFTQVTAGLSYTCALEPDGDAQCWGDNTFGQAPPGGVTGPFTQVTAGGSHTCALEPDGDAQCWGRNAHGEAPASVSGPFTQVTAGGDDHTCALRPNGDAHCWGDNTFRQAPPGGVTGPFIQLTAGGSHTCALEPNGDAQCWGQNAQGQAPAQVSGPFGGKAVSAGSYGTCGILPNGDVQCWGDSEQAPPDVPGPFTQISGGRMHACGILANGDAQCWGLNHYGQAPPGGVAGPFTQITAGAHHTCALKPNGDAQCWGNNFDGQAPPAVAGPFTRVSAGGGHTCALEPNGDAHCWGDDYYGQAPPGGVAGPFIQIAAGEHHTCALEPNGDAHCWGYDYNGEAPPDGVTGPFTQITAGGSHTCALEPDGDVQCWGDNTFGQTPPDVPGPFAQIAAGQGHTCALMPDGKTRCWGADSDGQLGGAPSISGTPPDGHVDSAYSFAFGSGLAAGPLTTFGLAGGALPDGLSLGADGSIAGTPTTVGTFDFDVRAGNSWFGPDDVRSYSITIGEALPVLRVSLAGAGFGSVQSSPWGIFCPPDCTEAYAPGTAVTLTAIGSFFTGWSGDCTGPGACVVTMDAPRSVTATFSGPLPPFGSFDTPAGGTVTGAVPVTGWALDDREVIRVAVYRSEPGGQCYVGDATFVPGARPDVAAAFPSYPNADRAGWGYMLLTNILPDGPHALQAYAFDGNANVVFLGSKAITCANATATRPFGTIDTPAQGQSVSGNAYLVWGWTLTPAPAAIPTDGSTIRVFVDGVPVGRPVYDLYREDIATLFPGYANSNGAVGYYVLDTTALTDGMHAISWEVTDDLDRKEGIGSRYFWVTNTEQ